MTHVEEGIAAETIEKAIEKEKEKAFQQDFEKTMQSAVPELDRIRALGFMHKDEVAKLIAARDEEVTKIKKEWDYLKTYAAKKINAGENPVGKATNITEEIDPKKKEIADLEKELPGISAYIPE